MDADVYLKIKFGRQSAVELHYDDQKHPRPYSATA